MNRFYCTLCVLLLSFSVHATIYTFTGTGDMALASNWAGGIKPPDLLQLGDSVLVNGNAYLGAISVPGTITPLDPINSSKGTIIVALGYTLTFQNFTQFDNLGKLIIYGNVIFNRPFNQFPQSAIYVYG